jgi:hypothetical protein
MEQEKSWGGESSRTGEEAIPPAPFIRVQSLERSLPTPSSPHSFADIHKDATDWQLLDSRITSRRWYTRARLLSLAFPPDTRISSARRTRNSPVAAPLERAELGSPRLPSTLHSTPLCATLQFHSLPLCPALPRPSPPFPALSHSSPLFATPTPSPSRRYNDSHRPAF